ncbi:MAG TPA: N,N-dimethylformamidase beta subunit family domain-containing protein [Polyangiaceae bacterium]|nr:N,N-dimethylformamidase beta subunit family domain-containing protein [Polyangiaceae bacterium]HYQ30208.1 N,N-dimethylformamidase beta subunit family domain-containing protein [Polyangiaceae bacterium]
MNSEVEGYASTTSAALGDTVEIAVNVSRAQGVRWDLYRIGYYQGLGARLVSSGAPLPVEPQPGPSVSPKTGLLECDWATAIKLPVEASWLSGYYLLKLTSDDGFESHVPLVIRETGRKAPLLMQANVTRWQAYNLWGSINLYVNHLPAPKAFGALRGYQVSFDRPYSAVPDASMLIEHSMARWLEQHGYDVAYVTNIDLDTSPEHLEDRRLYMTAGHDEYWSLGERNALEDARDQGLSMAFFSGNTAYRRIRLEPSSRGIPRRVITCYKDASLDPARDAVDNTADYHMGPHARPENGMLGVLWAGWGTLEGFPFVVTEPDHWLYEGTGVKAGDSLGNIVGYEWDMVSDNHVSPENLEIVAASPALHEYGYTSQHHSTVFYPTASSFVFAAGTIGWARGLSDDGVASAKVQRVTENILSRAGLFPEGPVVRPTSVGYEHGALAAKSRVLAGTGKAGHEDGDARNARFHCPSGIAVGPEGELFVCDTGNNQVRKISVDGRVSTVLGTGDIKLQTPTGIAVDASGNVYVSDTGTSRIVFLGNDGFSTVYSGRTHVAGNVDDPDRGNARFNLQRGLTIDPNGLLYVADLRNDSIRRIDPTTGAVSTVVTLAGGPTAVAVSADGTLYYLATWLGSIISVSPDGKRTVLANQKQIFGDRGGPGAQAALRPADGLILTSDGLVFTDTGNNRVRALSLDAHNGVVTLLGTGRGGDGVGEGAGTELCLPRSIAAVADGYVVADTMNHRILHFSNDPGAFFTR